MIEQKVYQGWLWDTNQGGRYLSEEGEYLEEGLYLRPAELDGEEFADVLSDLLKDEIGNKQVSVRYWINDKSCTREEAKGHFTNKLLGILDAEWNPVYGDVTGFLWADEHLRVGGHDLLRELRSFHGRWLILEVDIHATA